MQTFKELINNKLCIKLKLNNPKVKTAIITVLATDHEQLNIMARNPGHNLFYFHANLHIF